MFTEERVREGTDGGGGYSHRVSLSVAHSPAHIDTHLTHIYIYRHLNNTQKKQECIKSPVLDGIGYVVGCNETEIFSC